MGYVPDEALPGLYSGADLFVFPSTYEGFGIPLLEAMHCEVPILASNVTSLPEVAGEAALYVDPQNISSIADGMKSLACDEKLRNDLIARGRIRRSAFSWDLAAHGLWTSLQKIASEI